MNRICTKPIFDTLRRPFGATGPAFEVLDEDGLYAAPLCIDGDVYGDEILAEWEQTPTAFRLVRFCIGHRFFDRDDAIDMTGKPHVEAQERAIRELADAHERETRRAAGLPAYAAE